MVKYRSEPIFTMARLGWIIIDASGSRAVLDALCRGGMERWRGIGTFAKQLHVSELGKGRGVWGKMRLDGKTGLLELTCSGMRVAQEWWRLSWRAGFCKRTRREDLGSDIYV